MNHLEHIRIRNFRLFDSLDIERVGQVNLITGKNNCGKTTLLEALRIDACELSHEYNSVIIDVLKRRGELDNAVPQFYMPKLFHDISAINPIFINDTKIWNENIGQETRFGNFLIKHESNDRIIGYKIEYANNEKPIDYASFIPFDSDFDYSSLWDEIQLTDKEDFVVDVLKLIEPRIERISIDTKRLSAKIRLKGESHPISLKVFGEGMNRLLIIAMGLIKANHESSLLLIDEIDLGLHHSVQEKLWEIVFSTAKKLNVQVFATTHSRDCRDAFSKIWDQYPDMGAYFRLEKNKSGAGFRAVDYDREMLESAVYQEMETR